MLSQAFGLFYACQGTFFSGCSFRLYGRGVLGCDRLRPQAAEVAAEHSPSTPSSLVSFRDPTRPLSLPRLAANASSGLRPSANSNLFPGTYRREATVELASWEISPRLSVAAPRYWARRSITGAKANCGRWHDRGAVDRFAEASSFAVNRPRHPKHHAHSDAADAVVRLRYNCFASNR
jgi:hypothetical protein